MAQDPHIDFPSLKEAIKEIAARRSMRNYGDMSEKAAEIVARRQRDALAK